MIPLFAYCWSPIGGSGGGAVRGTFPSDIPVPDNIVVSANVPHMSENVNVSSIAHELAHAIGIGWESYGSRCNNQFYSLMSCTSGNPELQLFHLDPWAKIKLGWIRPDIITIDKERIIEINATELPTKFSKKAYIVYDQTRGKSEFFILEHRFRDSALNYDNDPWLVGKKGIPDDGLGIWHVLINHSTKNLRYIPAISQFQTPTDKVGLHSWYSVERKDNFTTSNPRWGMVYIK